MTLSRRGSRDGTSSTTVRYFELMSLFVPCVMCSTWAVSFCCTSTRASPRIHLNSASTRLRPRAAHVRASLRADFLLNTARPPVSVSLALYRLLLNASRLPCLSYPGLHVIPARQSLHALSSQARHWLEVRTIVFWTLMSSSMNCT